MASLRLPFFRAVKPNRRIVRGSSLSLKCFSGSNATVCPAGAETSTPATRTTSRCRHQSDCNLEHRIPGCDCHTSTTRFQPDCPKASATSAHSSNHLPKHLPLGVVGLSFIKPVTLNDLISVSTVKPTNFDRLAAKRPPFNRVLAALSLICGLKTAKSLDCEHIGKLAWWLL